MFVYFLGIIDNGLTPATIYYRFMIYAFLLYHAGVFFSRDERFLVLLKFFIFCFFVFSVILLFLELAFTEDFYYIFSFNDYFSKKMNVGYFLAPEEFYLKNNKYLFNFEGFKEIKVMRPYGALLHPISLGYFFSIVSVYLFYRKHYFLFLLSALLVVIMGAKGAAISLAMTIFVYVVLVHSCFSRSKVFLVLVFLSIALSCLLFYIGFSVGNPHMVKLAWSINEVLNAPFGKGLGSSGVFSSIGSGNDESLFKDSGLAVLLGQFGVLSIIVYFVYYNIVYRCFACFWGSRLVLFPILAVFVLMNSFFQEEGFSPYSLGLCLFLMGVWSEKYKSEGKYKSE